MQRFRAILLLLIIGITLIPWQSICMAHPLGHDHHEHEGPSPCELRAKAIAESDGPILLPPMDCEHISDAMDDYNQTQVKRIAPTIQMIAVAAVIFDLVHFEITERPFLLPPEPNCRSAILLSDSPLREPPLV